MRVTRSCEVIKGMLTRASAEKRLRSLMLRVWTVEVVVIGSCLGYRRALHHLALRSKRGLPSANETWRQITPEIQVFWLLSGWLMVDLPNLSALPETGM